MHHSCVLKAAAKSLVKRDRFSLSAVSTCRTRLIETGVFSISTPSSLCHCDSSSLQCGLFSCKNRTIVWYHVGMRIISWNLNGLRAVVKKDKWEQIFIAGKDGAAPDIVCLQETKANPDQLAEEVRNRAGYFSYFDHPKEKKGYSGVAIYSKVKPEKVQYEMGDPVLDNEGRLIAAYYKDFVLVNVYFPNGGGGPDRLKYKLDFYAEFLKFLEKTRKKCKNIVFCGDINTAHTAIDLARPKENEENTGFLPIERAWLDKVVKHKYVDTFRHFYPDKVGAYTYWDQKTFARDRNVGWRIDYFFVTDEALKHVKAAGIMNDLFGSDHCPLFIDVDFGEK